MEGALKRLQVCFQEKHHVWLHPTSEGYSEAKKKKREKKEKEKNKARCGGGSFLLYGNAVSQMSLVQKVSFFAAFKRYRRIRFGSTQLGCLLVASRAALWRQRLGITEVSPIVSGAEALIHPWKDLALGNFIMQMSARAPVPATVLKKDAGGGWQDTYGLAGRSIHLQEACHRRHYSQWSPDQLQLSPFLGLTGKKWH